MTISSGWASSFWFVQRLPALILFLTIAIIFHGTSHAQNAFALKAGTAYSVIDVAANDVLNLRVEPNPKAATIAAIPQDGAGLIATGNVTVSSGQTWIEVRFKTDTGWVNARYLRQAPNDVKDGDHPDAIASPPASKPLSTTASISDAATRVDKPFKRVALVIGNSSYAHVPTLTNPKNDAVAVANALESVGFTDVLRLVNQTRSEMEAALNDFSTRSRYAEIALVYFAGHGLEVNGANYVIPIDAHLRGADELSNQTISLSTIMETIDSAQGLKLIVLDACRDNPFRARLAAAEAARSLPPNVQRNVVGRGLAAVAAGRNTLVAYAAKHGSFALDGRGANSPFATAFVRHLQTPGLEIGLLLRRVRDDVLTETLQAQEPFTYGSIGGDAVYLSPLSGGIDLPKWNPDLRKDGYRSSLRRITDPILATIDKSNFAALAAFVHPFNGLRVSISPYFDDRSSTVFKREALVAPDFRAKVFDWPKDYDDGPGPIPVDEYFSKRIYTRDYLKAPEFEFSAAKKEGGADQDAVFETFPGSVFVDYHFPSQGTDNALNWSTLRLVFQELQGRWYVVAVTVLHWNP